ncbi:MAG TPA: glycosyltransferase [Bryobacteraceae bacterium]|nr:glycosyltransferase [Bryobacteraceae bacterium]
MKVLWVNSNFMHPTTKGGQIRTLEMLRHLHRWHEIHYVAIENPAQPEGPARAHEYSTRSYPFRYRIPDKTSPAFWGQLAAGLVSSVPVAVSRFDPPGMRAFLEDLIRRERFDRAVVDHLAPTAYFPDLAHSVFFQHNVETVIWRRHVEHSTGLRRWYFQLQAERMLAYERRVSLEAGHIVAVSAADAEQMHKLFGVTRVSEIPTGVNLEYFLPPESRPAPSVDLVFIGSMDWLPNADGMVYFVREILPLIRRKRPNCSLAIVGRTPPLRIQELADRDPLIQVTGTVPDIRPYLWDSAVSIVPLRIGGGTRLKIYEAMAAKAAVVSTTIGAEGLTIHPPDDIRIADEPADFADACLELLADPARRERQAAAAWEMVAASYSWERVSRCFESILDSGPPLC